MKKYKVGIIGCGNICGIYFKAGATFEIIDIVACADIVPGLAQAKAEEFGVPKACSVEELLADPEVETLVGDYKIDLINRRVLLENRDSGFVVNAKPADKTESPHEVSPIVCIKSNAAA